MSDALDMPFDQYQRYRLVSALVESLRSGSAGMTILDVGGRTALLRRFLAKDKVTLVDVETSAEPGLVLGDGSALPFKDGSFDLVCAFDTLEHVPPAGRERFLSECYRVSKKHVVIVGPYQAPEVEEAEVLLQRFLKDKLGVEHRYLEEHRHNGLPDRGVTEEAFRKLGARVVSIGHGNVHRWLGLISLSMYLDYTPSLQDMAPRLARFYNGALFATDTLAPVYRHAVVAAKGRAKLPEASLPKLPAEATPGARAIERFATELAAFDARRDGWEREWNRLKVVIGGLEKDLAEHKAALSELRERKQELEQVCSTLELDLGGHKASIEDLRTELKRYPAEIAAFEASVAALQSDLEQHRAQDLALHSQIDALEAERARLMELRTAEHAQAEQRAGIMEADLEGHRKALSELEHDLAEHRRTLEAEREAHAAETDALHAMLAGHEQRILEYTQVVRAHETDLSATRETLAAVRSELAAVDAERMHLAQLRAAEHSQALAQRAQLEQAIASHAEQGARFEALFHAEQDARTADIRVLRAELEAQGGVIATLELDLAGHRSALQAWQERHAMLLAEHEAVLADRAVIDADRAAIIADRAAIAADREAAHERLAQQAAFIEDQRQQLSAAARKLEEREALIGALRAELRNRWRSFKRVFGRKSTL